MGPSPDQLRCSDNSNRRNGNDCNSGHDCNGSGNSLRFHRRHNSLTDTYANSHSNALSNGNAHTFAHGDTNSFTNCDAHTDAQCVPFPHGYTCTDTSSHTLP